MQKPIMAFVKDLKSNKKLHALDEASTKQAVALRLLSLVGWDIFNVEEVYPDFSSESDTASYALRIEGVSKMLLDVKRPGANPDGLHKQLVAFAAREGVDVAAHTEDVRSLPEGVRVRLPPRVLAGGDAETPRDAAARQPHLGARRAHDEDRRQHALVQDHPDARRGQDPDCLRGGLRERCRALLHELPKQVRRRGAGLLGPVPFLAAGELRRRLRHEQRGVRADRHGPGPLGAGRGGHHRHDRAHGRYRHCDQGGHHEGARAAAKNVVIKGVSKAAVRETITKLAKDAGKDLATATVENLASMAVGEDFDPYSLDPTGIASVVTAYNHSVCPT